MVGDLNRQTRIKTSHLQRHLINHDKILRQQKSLKRERKGERATWV